MSTESMLNEYLARTRAREERAERSEIVRRVEQVFDELKLPWQRDRDGDGADWEIDSDVGLIRSGLDDDEEVLTFSHVIHTLEKSPKKEADYLYALLSMNGDAAGAWFAITEMPNIGAMVYVVGRLAAQKLDPEEVALTLQNMFAMLSLYDPAE